MRNASKINERKLYSALLSLNNHKECQSFLYDLLTPNERNVLIQRLEIAELITRGLTYAEISEITKASTATISRVSKALSYGTGGFMSVLEKIQ